MTQPSLFVFAGPNGSGKSSAFISIASDIEFVNADDFARRINPSNPSAAARPAGREVLRRLSLLLSAGHSFAYETTLSSQQSLRLLRECRNANYRIELAFFALRSEELAIRRIAARVQQGGHGIPDEIVRRRYKTSFNHLAEAMGWVDDLLIIDNSAEKPELILHVRQQVELVNCLSAGIELHDKIIRALETFLATQKAP